MLSEIREEEMKMQREKNLREWEEVLKKAEATTAEFLDDIEKIEKELNVRANEMHGEVNKILSQTRQNLQGFKTSGLAKLKNQEKYLADRLQQMKEEAPGYEDELTDSDSNDSLITLTRSREQTKPSKPPTLQSEFAPTFIRGQNEANLLEKMFGQLITGHSTVTPSVGTGASTTNLPLRQTSVEIRRPVGNLSLSPTSAGMSRPIGSLPLSQTRAGMTRPIGHLPLHNTSVGRSTSNLPVSLSKNTTGASKLFDTKKIAIVASQNKKRFLMHSPQVQFKFTVDKCYPSITCVEQNLAWVKTDDIQGTSLQLVDRKGSVKDRMKVNFRSHGMAVTSDGDILLADNLNKSIILVSRQKKSTTLFQTNWKPNGLCCLQNKDIVVAFPDDRKVVVYSSNGVVKNTLDHIEFKYPDKVAVNKVNQDIYICDHNFYNNNGKVVAVGMTGNFKFEYPGHNEEQFTLVDVCTDQMGHILIADHDYDCVHILDQEGQFLQYILNLDDPYSIDVDGEGYVWVGENKTATEGCVKVARYLL